MTTNEGQVFVAILPLVTLNAFTHSSADEAG